MMNLFSAIELGKNSILAQQQVFSVIGHNIANVNTPGYSRQVVDLENVRPSVIGYKEGGQGVNVVGIRSIRDRFIDNQIVDVKQYLSHYETLGNVMGTIETLFDEAHGLGISDSLTSFFNAWNDLADQPNNVPTRNSLVSKANSFTTQMNNTFQRLIDQQEVYDGNIAVMVDQINNITDEIAQLNQKIAYSEGANIPANDLLDTRERRIRELSEMIDINFYFEQNNNSVTIETAGRPLVTFNVVNHLSVQRNQYNSNFYDVYVDQYGQPAFNITNEIDGGKIGAYILARDGQVVNGAGTVTDGGLDPVSGTYRVLNFSQAHGLSAGDLVTVGGETRSVVSITNSTQVWVADFTNPLPAGAQGWQERDGYIPEYRNQLNKLATGLIYNVNDLHQQGYTLNGVTQTGQNFFQMTAGPAAITATAAVVPPGTTVTFNGDVSTYLSVGDAITINGETRLITTVTPGAGLSTVTVDRGFTAAFGGAGWEYAGVQTNATLMAVDTNIVNDSSLIAASGQPTQVAPFAVGNNDQALAIAQLMDSNSTVDTDNDGNVDYGTFHEYLHTLFTEIGNAGNSAIYEAEANGTMVNYLENLRDSISAVSLDEEAANLMQFEKSYQALTQFMGTVSQLTDLLMRIV